MPQFKREVIAPLHEKLTLTLAKDEFFPKVEQGLKKLAKQVSIKGFRQGMVPAGMVRKMYGNDVMAEEISKLANENLDNYIRENDIKFLGNPLAMPVLGQSTDINNPGDYTFEFEIGLQPEFEIPALKGKDAVVSYQIIVDDELVQKEMEYEQTRHGKSEETDTIIADDVISVDVNSNDGKFTKTVNLLISAVKNEAAKATLLKLEKEVNVPFDLLAAYDGDKEMIVHKILNIGHDVADNMDFSQMNITLRKIFRLQKAPIDQVLFDKVFPGRGILNEDDFKVALKEELVKVYANETEKKLSYDIQDKLVAASKMDLPAAFLRKWIISVNKEKVDEARLDAEFEAVLNDTRWTLIKNKLITDNNLQVQEQELQDNVMQYLEQTYGNMDPSFLMDLSKRILSNEKEREYMVEQMIAKRVMDTVKAQNTIETKSITMSEYEHLVSHHH